MWYVYVIYSFKDKGFYTGCTNNLKKRLEEHNRGMVESTKERRPLKLIYCEASLNRKDAFKREKYLKSGYGKRWLKKRVKNSLIDLTRKAA